MLGIFDSGLGGLSVAAATRALSPTGDLVVLVDQANAPYGDRPVGDVFALTARAVDRLEVLGCDTMVLACNTASAAALHALRAERPHLRLVGMEPAVKPAVDATRSGVIAVLATTATIEGPLLASVTARFAGDRRVIGVPLPGLVEMIEDGLAESPAVERFLIERLAEPLAAGADTWVLACTHYRFVEPAIRRGLGPDAVIIDPAEAVARQALRVGGGAGDGSTRILTTGDPVRTRRQVRLMLDWDHPVERI